MTGDFIYEKLNSKLNNKILLVTPGDEITKDNCELISENNISQNISKSENFKLEFEKDKLPIYFFNAKRKNKKKNKTYYF